LVEDRKVTSKRSLLMSDKIKGVLIMAIFKLFGTILMTAPFVLAASLQETCSAEKISKIKECISIYDRVTFRYIQDWLEYNTLLHIGFQNRTLEAEQLRDKAYLASSRFAIDQLRNLKPLLLRQQRLNAYDPNLIDAAKKFLDHHELVVEKTLMKF
jgi:hypothetical protein